MAPLGGGQARTRPRRPQPKLITAPEYSDIDELADDILEEQPPLKRLRTSRRSSQRPRWIPGGRGGGGRHMETQETGISEASTPLNEEYTEKRSRGGRDIKRTMGATPRYSARSSRTRGAARPRYSTAAAASAAVAHGDGYKPREERGWEEFHPDLELTSEFIVLNAEAVDGTANQPETNSPAIQHESEDELNEFDRTGGSNTPSRRKVGRPYRNRDSMLNGLFTPEAPKVIPLPGPNPREKLTLPKPSYRELDPFLVYEQKGIAQVNFVDRMMAHVGYQESEIYIRPYQTLIRQNEGSAEEDLELSPALAMEGQNFAIGSTGVGRVEYDMDEQDVKWLDEFNKTRLKDGVEAIKPAIFEITMTKIEKEWHALEKRIPKPNPKAPQTQRPRSSSAAAVNGEPGSEEPDSKCAVCNDGDCENANAIVFCDGCDLAVHQECYGVPYIPEGQWLCRKCLLVGNSRPSCIFCPNEGGAFKQTNNSKWAHLLCASWIPEVNIGNMSLMEPIVDVEKVPSSRWKLVCYICRQGMGACIQCSDGRCYKPFHLTCARQGGLYLKMKTTGGANSLMDKAQLRAYCHEHGPTDWQEDHYTEKAIIDAMRSFTKQFKHQIWADSRTSALATDETDGMLSSEAGVQRLIITNKKGQKQKTIWRLPSGAPVIPEVVLKSIEDSLMRFLVRKKKDYITEICKYWTLKREARRGAALLKRLQLQMDTFSSFEVTRRDYKAQGAAGRARLDRRIEFAEHLAKDLERIRDICEMVKAREAEKLQDALLLSNIIETVYFPIPPLLSPILERAYHLDPQNVFRAGFDEIRSKLAVRAYTSIAAFSSDLAQVLASDLGVEATSTADLQAQVVGRAVDMSSEQREKRNLAKRIINKVQPLVEDAARKEAEINGRPFEQQLKEMDQSLLSRRQSISDSIDLARSKSQSPTKLLNGTNHSTPIDNSIEMDIEMQDVRSESVNGIHEIVNRGINDEAGDTVSDGVIDMVIDGVSHGVNHEASEDTNHAIITVANDEASDTIKDAANDAAEMEVDEADIHKVNDANKPINDDVNEVNEVDEIIKVAHVPEDANCAESHDISMQDAVEQHLIADDPTSQLKDALSKKVEHISHAHTPPASTNGIKKDAITNVPSKKQSPAQEPPTPPISLEGNQQATVVHGGIPWYIEPFDVEGTTIYEERWTGRDVLRGMSEELSEMEEDELQELGGDEMEESEEETKDGSGKSDTLVKKKRKAAKRIGMLRNRRRR